MRNKSVLSGATVLLGALATAVVAQTQVEGTTAQRQSATVQQRILTAHKSFENAVAAFPDREMSVLVSLSAQTPIRDVVSLAQAHKLVIEGFRHGDSRHQGGYTFRAGESVADAIQAYERDELLFTRSGIENIDAMMGTAKDNVSKQAMLKTRADLVARQGEAQNGIRIIGIDLRGTGRALKTFAEANQVVRLVEVKENARINAAVLPTE